MPAKLTIPSIKISSLISGLSMLLIFNCIGCHGNRNDRQRDKDHSGIPDSITINGSPEEYQSVNTVLVLPKNPEPGKPFRILATGGKNISKAKIVVSGPAGSLESLKFNTSEELPYWRVDNFAGCSAGKYNVTVTTGNTNVSSVEFSITTGEVASPTSVVWKTLRGWDSSAEELFSVWINALFQGCDERSSWASLHEVTRNQNQNFLYNYLSLGEDDPDSKNSLVMQPDCADNPFFLRAYFAWKLGLPFGFHVCDRGSLGSDPKPGQWITNEITSSKTNAVQAFNNFLRLVMNGVQSATARTALDDENSDYYPVSLQRAALRPGTVFADPYGHTLIIVGWLLQTSDHPGLILAVDAQPDGTVGIKRFWKGNFLFKTSEVVGEPGFKAFRPLSFNNGVTKLVQNKDLTVAAGFVPFSLQQRKMETDVFYHTMERLINPKPLNPEEALLDQIIALHEQLLVRVTSVANGEAYFKSHPGAIIPMPSTAAGIFLAGGQWENFSTPNRDLRLLIAMDAVLDFPDLMVRSPDDFKISGNMPPEQVKKKVQLLLDKKVSELSISYTRTNGTSQKLTVGEILKRRDAFEMAYNPNDGIEIRWGAPENSEERSTCLRHSPQNQLEKMRSARTWFSKRLHPPT
jgi:hypothetical protein